MSKRNLLALLCAAALCLSGCFSSRVPPAVSLDPVAGLKASVDFFDIGADPYAAIPAENQPYGYTHLTDGQKILYRLLEHITLTPVEAGAIDATFSDDDMNRAFTAYFFDNYDTRFFHQLYKFSTHLYNDQPIYTTFELEPASRDLVALQTEMDVIVDGIMAAAPPDMTDYQKVRYLCETLADLIAYNEAAVPESEGYVNNEENQLCAYAYGALKNHSAICDGYAQAFAYVGKKMGLQIVTVFGTADNGEVKQSHAWNKVKLDGEWYAVDLTWYDMDVLRNKVFLLAADNEIADSHIEEEGANYYGFSFFPFPAANGHTYNALRQDGMCFSSADAAVSALLSRLTAGDRFVQLKLESEALMIETIDRINSYYDSEVELPRLADSLWCKVIETHAPSCTLIVQRVDVRFVSVYDE